MTDPFIIMSAPNGARRQKSDHPALPITPDDMAKCAGEIIDAGASILHLHVRDERGGHSLDVNRYRASITAIRDAVGDNIIIQATSEAVGIYSRHEQMAMVKTLRPEAVSLALRELCPGDDELSEFSAFTDWLSAEHVFPQYILYDMKDYLRFENYRTRGIFNDDSPFTLFVLGNYRNDTPEKDVDQLKRRTRQACRDTCAPRHPTGTPPCPARSSGRSRSAPWPGRSADSRECRRAWRTALHALPVVP